MLFATTRSLQPTRWSGRAGQQWTSLPQKSVVKRRYQFVSRGLFAAAQVAQHDFHSSMERRNRTLCKAVDQRGQLRPGQRQRAHIAFSRCSSDAPLPVALSRGWPLVHHCACALEQDLGLSKYVETDDTRQGSNAAADKQIERPALRKSQHHSCDVIPVLGTRDKAAVNTEVGRGTDCAAGMRVRGVDFDKECRRASCRCIAAHAWR